MKNNMTAPNNSYANAFPRLTLNLKSIMIMTIIMSVEASSVL